MVSRTKLPYESAVLTEKFHVPRQSVRSNKFQKPVDKVSRGVTPPAESPTISSEHVPRDLVEKRNLSVRGICENCGALVSLEGESTNCDEATVDRRGSIVDIIIINYYYLLL